jgi:hypothetical protein
MWGSKSVAGTKWGNARKWMGLAVFIFGSSRLPAFGQVAFEQPPIDYLNARPSDRVASLQAKLDAGEVSLQYDPEHGYLKSVLEQLGIPVSSQSLVFTKTSFQLKRISPQTPRAVYFNDDVYVGWVQGGDVMEVSTVDPHLGANFYTLSQTELVRPKFQRQTHECLQCHGSTLTKGVPGHVVRSVYPAPDGQPILSQGTYLTDHSSPLTERWGGWYVTGQHGAQRHLGNLLVRQGVDRDQVDTNPGANVTDLSKYFNTTPYLTPHSDIVALMVLEHQVNMHNLLTNANFLTRLALRDQRVMNEMLDRPADYQSETTIHRIRSAGEPVVKHLLFTGETKLTDPVSGTSGFSEEFSAGGARDDQGRSLRDFDLQSRLFKYPCSYAVYSAAFDTLPPSVKEYIYQRLWEVLSGKDTGKDFQHLSSADRQAIREILRATKPGLPEYWSRS